LKPNADSRSVWLEKILFEKILDRLKKSGKLGADLERREMKPKTIHIIDPNLKRCSWWWRANPTG
jgi:hypothetical protein